MWATKKIFGGTAEYDRNAACGGGAASVIVFRAHDALALAGNPNQSRKAQKVEAAERLKLVTCDWCRRRLDEAAKSRDD